MTADLLTEFDPLIQSIAAEGGKKFWRWGADREDFAQEFYLWVLDHAEWLAEKREEIEDDEQFTRFLARCLRNELSDYAVDIKAQAGGQDRASAFWYSKGELAMLLPSVFDRDAWLNPPQSDGKSVADPAMGNNWIATLADVAQAFARLELDDQNLLRAFHEDALRNKDLADMYEVSEATMSYRHSQALKRLLEKLGGEKPRHMRADQQHDPWRGRHSIGNAHARAITANDYEEN